MSFRFRPPDLPDDISDQDRASLRLSLACDLIDRLEYLHHLAPGDTVRIAAAAQAIRERIDMAAKLRRKTRTTKRHLH
jgi:hypothetical protein